MPAVKLPRPGWYDDATPPEPNAPGADDFRTDDGARNAWLDDAVVVAPMTPRPRQ